MPTPDPSARLDIASPVFEDLTLVFDIFHRGPAAVDGSIRLAARRFRRCNLTGPALVTVAEDTVFSDCIFSACAFTALPDGTPAPGSVLLQGCVFEDCVLTRWSVFVPPALLASLLHDMPHLRVFGLPFG